MNSPDRRGRQEFARLLAERGTSYYPDLNAGRMRVRLVRKSERLNSQLYEYELLDGSTRRRVIIKVPFAPKHVVENAPTPDLPHDDEDRPRLFPKAPPTVKGLYEHRALCAIRDRVAPQGADQFGAIRLLDLLPAPYTLVLEKAADPTFRRLFLQANWITNRLARNQLQKAFHHAGRWLQAFHQLADLPHTQIRHATFDQYSESSNRFLDYLLHYGAPNTKRRGLFDQIRRVLDRDAPNILPTTIPLGVGHGDYAMRNILVNRDSRVTVFDTLGRWRAPIYEDLAHFCIALKASGPQICTGGMLYRRRVLMEYEAAFLEGYFGGDSPPLETVRLYELQLLLEWWAALVHRSREAKGVKRNVKAIRLMVWSRHLHDYLEEIIK